MIAGETEILLNRYSEDYDDFFSWFKKKNRTEEEKKKRTEKRQKFWSGVGTTIQDLAALAIKPESGQTIHTTTPQTSSMDYQFSLGSGEGEGMKWKNRDEDEDDKEDEEDEEDEKSILPYVIGAVLVIGIGVWGFSTLKKANQLT